MPGLELEKVDVLVPERWNNIESDPDEIGLTLFGFADGLSKAVIIVYRPLIF